MDEFDYTPEELEMREERRQQRAAMKRKKHKQKQITLLTILVIILAVLTFVLIKSCSSGSAEAETPLVTETEENSEIPEVPTASVPDSTATLAAVGDIMVYQEQLDDALQDDGTYDFLPVLSQVADTLATADITVGNFEANFAGAPYVGYPNFSAPPELATTLSAIGFDILQTANTYSIQNGMQGLTSTVETIQNAKMTPLGTYTSTEDRATRQVAVAEVDGIKFAFIAFTKGLNNLNLPAESSGMVDLLFTDYYTNYSVVDTLAISNLVETAKATEADVIVSMVHWGNEYDTSISPTQTTISDLLFTSGVDVILGSHPHVVGPMKTQTVTVDGQDKEVFTAYSLGNFMSSMNKSNTLEGVILNLEFTKSGTTGDTTISDISYVPTYMMDNGETAENRYTIRSMDRILEEETDATLISTIETAKATLATNTQSNYAQ